MNTLKVVTVTALRKDAMEKQIEFEFIVDNPEELRPKVIDTNNALEDGYMPRGEELIISYRTKDESLLDELP